MKGTHASAYFETCGLSGPLALNDDHTGSGGRIEAGTCHVKHYHHGIFRIIVNLAEQLFLSKSAATHTCRLEQRN